MKKIFFVFSFLLLTGCTAEYNLVYENNIYKENVFVKSLKNEYCSESLCSTYYDSYYKNNITVDYRDNEEKLAEGINLNKYKFYNKELVNNEFYGIKLGYNFDYNFKYSYVVNQLFENFIVNENFIKADNIKDIFSIYTNLEEINITFKSDKKIESNNADKVEGDIYYWNIRRDNWENKYINIVFSGAENNDGSNNTNNDNKINFNKSVNFILVVLVIVILVSILVIYEKVKKSNKL